MARMRVHELAKSWGLESKDLLGRIEKLGILGKRSQSSLTEDEVERVQNELGLGDGPQVSVGEERVVTGETGEQVVQKRVGTKVIRRRAQPQSEPAYTTEPLQPLGVQSDVLEAFAAPEALPDLVQPVAPVTLPPVAEAPSDTPAAADAGTGRSPDDSDRCTGRERGAAGGRGVATRTAAAGRDDDGVERSSAARGGREAGGEREREASREEFFEGGGPEGAGEGRSAPDGGGADCRDARTRDCSGGGCRPWSSSTGSTGSTGFADGHRATRVGQTG